MHAIDVTAPYKHLSISGILPRFVCIIGHMEVSEFLIESVLHEQFGLTHFRPKQREVIDLVLAGKNTMALLPTGYGKSLCYQVPSQILPGTTVVISPLIALMQDQLSGLLKRGIKNATILNSSVSMDEVDFRIAGIKSGAYKLVFVAPERFESPRFRNLLESINVSLIVIDEAHCISQWGHDFRPQYRNLSSYLSKLDKATILALTATATPQVQRDILQSLQLPQLHLVTGSFDRPNIRLEVEQVSGAAEKDKFIFNALRKENSISIIYTSSRREAEALTDRLKHAGIQALCYHAGLHSDLRAKRQHDFENEKVRTIVSTVAFGMGVDKSNIRRVIHYNMPGSLENYYQEAGRAGRDGNHAVCTLLYQAKDIHTQRWMMERNFPTGAQVQQIFQLIAKRGMNPIRLSEIQSEFDIPDSALNSAIDLLKHLQLLDATVDGGMTTRVTSADIDMTWLNQRKLRHSNRLEQMIRYAQDPTCRRRQILGYFGQQTDVCSGCDICEPNMVLAGPAVTTEQAEKRAKSAHQPDSNLSQAILQLAYSINGRAGRTTLAQILCGSGAKKLKESGYTSLPNFGAFRAFKQDQLLDHIDDLVASADLRVSPGMYPKVQITQSGMGKLKDQALKG